MEQPGFESAPIWDTSTTGGGLAYYTQCQTQVSGLLTNVHLVLEVNFQGPEW